MSSSNSKSPIFPGGAPGKPLLPGRPELPGPPAALTPSAPIITGFSSDSGVVGDGTTNDTTLTISGTAQAIYAGATIELTAGVVVDGLPFPLGPTGSDLIGTAVLGSDGTWSIDVDLSSFQGFDVDVQFVALLTGASIFDSDPSEPFTVNLDTLPPSASAPESDTSGFFGNVGVILPDTQYSFDLDSGTKAGDTIQLVSVVPGFIPFSSPVDVPPSTDLRTFVQEFLSETGTGQTHHVRVRTSLFLNQVSIPMLRARGPS